MAEISVDFRNIVGSKKCAVSSPRIVSLEIGNESRSGANESAFQGFFLNDQVSCSDVNSDSNLICGFDKQIDKNFLIHSQSSLSASTYDERPSDKIKSTNDFDFDLRDLLSSAKLEETLECGAENFNSRKNTSDDKMKITPNVELSGGLSDLLSSIAHEITEKDEVNATTEYCERKNTQDYGIDLLDFDFAKNECPSSLSSNNSSLKVEDNLSELLSSINIEDSDVTKVGNLNSSNMCNSKVANRCKADKEPCLADLSDLLSSVYVESSNCNKASSCNQGKAKNGLCLASLSSVDINKSASALLNSKPLSFGSSSSFFKDTNGIPDSLNDFTFDVPYSSSSNSCASSYSETENDSPKDSLTKKNLMDKVFESDSGYNSFDTAPKEFSFFDYTSDNQFSFNTLLTKKSDSNIATKPYDCEDTRNTNEEMSMSDLLTIVSPEFKNPILATLNKTETLESEDSSSMLDLIESLNIQSKNSDPHVISKKLVEYDEKLMDFDCVDGQISEKVQGGMGKINFQADGSLGKDILIGGSDNVNDDDKIASDDEQINFIDLRECIKSANHQFIPTSPVKQDKSVENQSLECFSPNKILFYCEEKSPSDLSRNSSNSFEFSSTIPRAKSRINTKQTMFSKALACKAKKDPSLLQKVANIKNELLNNIIYRPVFIDCDVPQPIIESVLQSDRCILSNVGRIRFGLNTPCELQ